jgi:hypothetical protein
MRTRCTLLLRNRGAESKFTDFKESAEDAFAGLREAFECCEKGCEPPGEPVRSIVGSPRNWHPGDRASEAWDADFLVRFGCVIIIASEQQCPPHSCMK